MCHNAVQTTDELLSKAQPANGLHTVKVLFSRILASRLKFKNHSNHRILQSSQHFPWFYHTKLFLIKNNDLKMIVYLIGFNIVYVGYN